MIRVIQILASKAQLSLSGLAVRTQEKARKLLEEMHDPRWTKATLLARVLAGKARTIADEAAQQLRHKNHEAFRQWVFAGLADPGSGRAHRFISDKAPPIGHTEQGEPGDEDLLDSHEAMEARLCYWNQYWKGRDRVPDWPDWLED